MSNATLYTEEDLNGMSRLNLRREAVRILQIDNMEANTKKSEELIRMILEKQGGGGAKEESAPPKAARTRSMPRGTAATHAKPGNGATTEAAKEEADISGLIDAVGRAVDDLEQKLSTTTSETLELMNHTADRIFVLEGILEDIYKAVLEPDMYDKRLAALTKELEEAKAGNG